MIQIPQKGEPLRADWAAQITARVNSIAPVGAPGMLVRDGAGGFGAEPCPANRRNRRGTGGRAAPPGCFELQERSVTRDNVSRIEHFIVNQYYMVGDILKTVSLNDDGDQIEDSLESLLLASIRDDTPSGEMVSWIALQVDAKGDDEAVPQILVLADQEALNSQQSDLDFHTIPIYIVKYLYTAGEEADESGSITELEIVCDFRRGLFGQQVEFL